MASRPSRQSLINSIPHNCSLIRIKEQRGYILTGRNQIRLINSRCIFPIFWYVDNQGSRCYGWNHFLEAKNQTRRGDIRSSSLGRGLNRTSRQVRGCWWSHRGLWDAELLFPIYFGSPWPLYVSWGVLGGHVSVDSWWQLSNFVTLIGKLFSIFLKLW